MIDSALQILDHDDASFSPLSPAVPLALLAAGRFARVRDFISARPRTAALPLITARYVAWTGDIALASTLWDNLIEQTGTMLGPSGDDEQTVLRLATCVELERTATDLASPAIAARLVAAARDLRAALAGRPLAEATRRLASTIGIGVRPGFNTDFVQTDHGSAALAVLGLVHGVIAAEPDAVRGRIRIQPAMRGGWDRLAIRQLRFADGSIALDVERSAGKTTWSLSQPDGAIPYTALLEPIVTGPVGATEVDGKPASLDRRDHNGLVLVPVQLVLDDTRTLVLHHAS